MEVRQPPPHGPEVVQQQIHKRKSSIEKDENLVILPNGDLQTQTLASSTPKPAPAPSSELQSNGHTAPVATGTSTTLSGTSTRAPLLLPLPASSRPSSSYSTLSPLSATNGHPASPFRSTFGHARSNSRSVSAQGPFSPLSASFPSTSSPSTASFPSHSSTPSMSDPNTDLLPLPTTTPTSLLDPSTPSTRRHSRLHSRNLSIFFPRPGSLPESYIAEDGTQELQVGRTDEEAGVLVGSPPTSRADAHRGKLQGFTFGGRPNGIHNDINNGASSLSIPGSGTTSTARRGHHHKHSLSHQFFSFLEPGSTPADLHTAPTPTPVSPWNPISPFPTSAPPTHTHPPLLSPPAHAHPATPVPRTPLPFLCTLLQFLLGAYLWVTGQSIGSLSCTGLGYWVVFDAFGVGQGAGVLGAALARTGKGGVRRPYGTARTETVAAFAACVYLMFSSVYVCKETVEHLLLSAGEAGHHHHRGDEEPLTLGIEFPISLVFVTLLSLLGTALYFSNHAKLVQTTGTHLPPLRTLIRDALARYPSAPSPSVPPPPTSRLAVVLANPFTLAPVGFCLAILGASAFLPLLHYRTFDLVLAALETGVTFCVSYRASVVLGTVLLQTAPERRLSGGRMEAFLRAMRDVERHPQVLHLPAPHIWQLTPSFTDTPHSPQPYHSQSPSHSHEDHAKHPSRSLSLVVTMELHVRRDLGDDDVLELTRWAWERCVDGLCFGVVGGGGRAEVEVTVGVVRG